MPFQFLCPQGHLLQGELWQAGQQSMCPICQSVFLIPSPGVGGSAAGGQIVSGSGGMVPYVGGKFPSTEGAALPPSGAIGPPLSGLMSASEAPTPFLARPLPEGSWPSGQGSPPSKASFSWPSPGQEAPTAQMPGIGLESPLGTGAETPPVHILCPSGHQLETPREMLGQEAICPFCQVQFRLRWEDTVEYRREKQLEVERRLARQSKLWLQWSIAAAVVVLVALIIMIAMVASR
ncbi:MAG: hypothetical protein NZ602_03120 [Thermoguttaceae bacterium]|nr:hypothetical protein [Thermoguttaceae bacterium]MDW8036416.1 hypothetical protein [Thermoguttaceae bacterium]